MICAVTGSAGYVGSRVAALLRAGGWDIRELARRQGFDLEAPDHGPLVEGADALVHCAWDWTARTPDDIGRINVDGSRRLVAAAHAAGVRRVVFVSTLSAFPGCRSLYGRAKLAVEALVRELDGATIRPGLVWGPRPTGLYGALARIADLPVAPTIAGARRLHLSHEDDVAALVRTLLESEAPGTDPIVAAAGEAVALPEILRRLARARGRRIRLVPVPWAAPWAALRALEAAGLKPGFRSDSVLSLVSLDEEPLSSGARPSPVPFRPFAP